MRYSLVVSLMVAACSGGESAPTPQAYGLIGPGTLGGGGGGGTVTSVVIGAGLTSTQSPLTTTGTIDIKAGTAAGQQPQWDGTQWQTQNRNPILDAASTKWIEANFCEAIQGGNSIGYSNSGTASGFATTGATFAIGHPCILEMDVGTTTNGRASFGTSPMLEIGSAAAGVIWYEEDVQIPTLSTAALEFADLIGPSSAATTSINSSAQIGFVYDRGNSATAPTTGAGNASNLNNWICRTGDAGVYTEYVMDGVQVSDTGFTTVNEPIVAGDWYKLRFIYNATPGEVDFYVSHNGGPLTKACVINTHIPSATQGTTHNVAAISHYHVGVAGATNRIINTDYAWFYNFGLSR